MLGFQSCVDYVGNVGKCGQYDSQDFQANTMCCVCGGGDRGDTSKQRF